MLSDADICTWFKLHSRTAWRLFTFVALSSLCRKNRCRARHGCTATKLTVFATSTFLWPKNYFVSILSVCASSGHDYEWRSVEGCFYGALMYTQLVCIHTNVPYFGFFRYVAGHRPTYWPRIPLFRPRSCWAAARTSLCSGLHQDWFGTSVCLSGTLPHLFFAGSHRR